MKPYEQRKAKRKEADSMVETERAIQTAKLWRAGKMLGGDPYKVVDVLLSEIERLNVNLTDEVRSEDSL